MRQAFRGCEVCDRVYASVRDTCPYCAKREATLPDEAFDWQTGAAWIGLGLFGAPALYLVLVVLLGAMGRG